MTSRRDTKVLQINMPTRLKAELMVASQLDDNKTMQRFCIDAIRDRVELVMERFKGHIPVGHPLYRPEGTRGRPDRETATRNAIERINELVEVPNPPDYHQIPNPQPHPLGRHLPGGQKYAPNPSG